MNNGGFDQYFFNSSGDWARYTTVALTDIVLGARQVCFRSIVAFPAASRTRKHRRWEELDRVDQSTLSKLDRTFTKNKTI